MSMNSLDEDLSQFVLLGQIHLLGRGGDVTASPTCLHSCIELVSCKFLESQELVLSGDFCQLPPVAGDEGVYPSPPRLHSMPRHGINVLADQSVLRKSSDRKTRVSYHAFHDCSIY